MELPEHFQRFRDRYPEVYKAYENLGAEVHGAGPLDEQQRSLIKLAISAGAGMEGAVHSATRKAVEAGCSRDEICQTVLLCIPTIGFPASMAVLSWVYDIIGK